RDDDPARAELRLCLVDNGDRARTAGGKLPLRRRSGSWRHSERQRTGTLSPENGHVDRPGAHVLEETRILIIIDEAQGGSNQCLATYAIYGGDHGPCRRFKDSAERSPSTCDKARRSGQGDMPPRAARR